eukprot:232591-Rhodomonas_salina.1
MRCPVLTYAIVLPAFVCFVLAAVGMSSVSLHAANSNARNLEPGTTCADRMVLVCNVVPVLCGTAAVLSAYAAVQHVRYCCYASSIRARYNISSTDMRCAATRQRVLGPRTQRYDLAPRLAQSRVAREQSRVAA